MGLCLNFRLTNSEWSQDSFSLRLILQLQTPYTSGMQPFLGNGATTQFKALNHPNPAFVSSVTTISLRLTEIH